MSSYTVDTSIHKPVSFLPPQRYHVFKREENKLFFQRPVIDQVNELFQRLQSGLSSSFKTLYQFTTRVTDLSSVHSHRNKSLDPADGHTYTHTNTSQLKKKKTNEITNEMEL